MQGGILDATLIQRVDHSLTVVERGEKRRREEVACAERAQCWTDARTNVRRGIPGKVTIVVPRLLSLMHVASRGKSSNSYTSFTEIIRRVQAFLAAALIWRHLSPSHLTGSSGLCLLSSISAGLSSAKTDSFQKSSAGVDTDMSDAEHPRRDRTRVIVPHLQRCECAGRAWLVLVEPACISSHPSFSRPVVEGPHAKRDPKRRGDRPFLGDRKTNRNGEHAATTERNGQLELSVGRHLVARADGPHCFFLPG